MGEGMRSGVRASDSGPSTCAPVIVTRETSETGTYKRFRRARSPGQHFRTYVEVTGSDGYDAIFSFGDLDPV
jgi:hypothetical protein